ncbi:hypothetical protein F5Y10DRAFT_261423 [Nemania abortiva]|nr:hypothetical protein F5Y10DRAFT_261423 [Nemania abortiva]
MASTLHQSTSPPPGWKTHAIPTSEVNATWLKSYLEKEYKGQYTVEWELLGRSYYISTPNGLNLRGYTEMKSPIPRTRTTVIRESTHSLEPSAYSRLRGTTPERASKGFTRAFHRFYEHCKRCYKGVRGDQAGVSNISQVHIKKDVLE